MAEEFRTFNVENECDHVIKISFIPDDIDEDFRIYIPRQYFVDFSQLIKLIVNGVEIRKNDSVYGWEILTDINDTYIQFKFFFRLPADTPIYLIFKTYRPKCLKCYGSGLTIDFAHNGFGQFNTVTQADMIVQNIDKFLLSDKNSSLYNTELGIDYERVYAGNSPEEIQYLMFDEVQRNMKNLVILTSDFPQEYRITNINSIDVEIDADNPFVVNIDIDIDVSGTSLFYNKFLDVRNNSFLALESQ